MLGWAWWTLLLLRGLLPAVFAIATGITVGAANRHESLSCPILLVGLLFGLLQILPPLHRGISSNLGNRTAGWLYDSLTRTCLHPVGVAHLEDPKFAGDLSMARDFDLGMSGPPLSICMDFIASGLVEMVGGLAATCVLFGFAWWAPFVIAGAWLGTHYLLKESGIWKDRNTEPVRQAQKHADYAYELAVEPPAAKELRLFGLAEWVVQRFATHRKTLLDLQWEATRLRERSVVTSLMLALAANLLVFGAIARSAASGSLTLAEAVTYFSAASAASMIAFGGLSWALDTASAPVAAVVALQTSTRSLVRVGTRKAEAFPQREIRFRDVRFSYAPDAEPVLDGFNLTIPAGSSLAIVGVNGAGKTTLAKLLCRLYDPQGGSIEADGVDIRDLDVTAWRSRLAAVFQDFVRFELTLRENVAPSGAPDAMIRASLVEVGGEKLGPLDTILAKGYPGGTDLSGGQWQRVAIARALCAVKQGIGVIVLDEPTAQLDVRGETEIFERILQATRHATTILVSHRFSTVRKVDRICVLEHGKVIELGSHEELMAAGGRYRTMFELQASRFASGLPEEDGGEPLDA